MNRVPDTADTTLGTRHADLRVVSFAEVFMEHTHEYDCVVCGAHFDSEDALHRHDQAEHTPKLAVDVQAPAEPMGNERHRGPTEPPDSMS